MKTPLELQDLVADVVHSYPPAQFEFDPLPSGVCFFWLTLNGHSFVLEYHPTQGTGVSENFPDTPPFIGHDEAFDSLGDAVRRFKTLLDDALRNPIQESQALVLRENFPN